MIVILVVPFMEFTLPVLLKLFPNFLPSTFEDGLKKEEKMKKELKMRLAMADFMKDMLRSASDLCSLFFSLPVVLLPFLRVPLFSGRWQRM